MTDENAAKKQGNKKPLDDFLGLEDPANCDIAWFISEANDKSYRKSQTDPWYAFFSYKAEKKRNHAGKGGYLNSVEDENLGNKIKQFVNDSLKLGLKDPDCSGSSKNPAPLLVKIYDASGFYKDERESLTPKSDTMTSAQNFVNAAVTKILKSVPDSVGSLYKKGDIKTGATNNALALWVANENEKDSRTTLFNLLDEEIPALKDFIAANHTIGNYCPVPELFNTNRSGSFASHDFWDLTLMKIREYFVTENSAKVKLPNDRESLWQLLTPGHDRVINTTKAWLDSFGSGASAWQSFVETYMFEDYVDEDSETWEVKPFWPGHSYEKPGLPSDETEFNIALCEVTFRIKARTVRIIDKLRKNLGREKSDTEASENPGETQGNE